MRVINQRIGDASRNVQPRAAGQRRALVDPAGRSLSGSLSVTHLGRRRGRLVDSPRLKHDHTHPACLGLWGDAAPSAGPMEDTVKQSTGLLVGLDSRTPGQDQITLRIRSRRWSTASTADIVEALKSASARIRSLPSAWWSHLRRNCPRATRTPVSFTRPRWCSAAVPRGQRATEHRRGTD